MDDVVYEKVDRLDAVGADLALRRQYTSDEAEVTLVVAWRTAVSVVRRRPDTKIALAATYKDGFNGRLGKRPLLARCGGER